MWTLWKINYDNANSVCQNRGDHMDKQMTIMPTIETTKECGKLVEKGGLPLFEKIILRV